MTLDLVLARQFLKLLEEEIFIITVGQDLSDHRCVVFTESLLVRGLVDKRLAEKD